MIKWWYTVYYVSVSVSRFLWRFMHKTEWFNLLRVLPQSGTDMPFIVWGVALYLSPPPFFPQLSTCWEYHHCTLHHGNHFCNTQGACNIQTQDSSWIWVWLSISSNRDVCQNSKSQLEEHYTWDIACECYFTGLLQKRDLEISWFRHCDSLGCKLPLIVQNAMYGGKDRALFVPLLF